MTTDKSTELTYPEVPELALARRLDEIAEANEDGYAMAGAMVIRRLHARVQELEQAVADEQAACIEAVRVEMERWRGEQDVTDFRLAIAAIRARGARGDAK